ncbi:MAG: PspC domain-containing protein [Proteobacteria bacterium]|nr:PspC domain-containing protein [Pseudomonadota bacterium]
MSKDRRDAEQVARRARRLAERAAERARRKEQQAKRAQERAERLAERVKRRARKDGNLDRSIEDFFDDMTNKAERWIDDQAKRFFSSPEEVREIRRARIDARRAREEADRARDSAARAGKAADDLSVLENEFDRSRQSRSAAHDLYGEMDDDSGLYDMGLDDLGLHDSGFDDLEMDDAGFDDDGFGHRSRRARRSARRQAKQRKYGAGRDPEGSSWHGFDWGESWYGSRRRARSRKTTHLYHDKQRKRVLGVCAGLADYWGRPTWEIRLYTVLGLFFIPSVTVPAYFILYFLMDEKPYYRRVTDRFDESADGRHKKSKGDRFTREDESAMQQAAEARSKLNNEQAMKTAREKFADIEQRLRQMESHVTSSRFELQREFRKMAGED